MTTQTGTQESATEAIQFGWVGSLHAAGHGTNKVYGAPPVASGKKDTNHPPPPDRLSVAAAVVFSILGAIIVVAVIVIIIGVVHKH